MNKVLITGVSGSGKSALSQILRDRGYAAHDTEEIDGLYKMVNKETGDEVTGWDNFDSEAVKNRDWICNVEMLKELLAKEKKDLVFYCGAASNINELIPLFDMVILLVADKKIIRERLTSRTSNDFGRAKGVQDLVVGWKDWWEKDLKEKGAVVVNANNDLDKVATEVLEKTQI